MKNLERPRSDATHWFPQHLKSRSKRREDKKPVWTTQTELCSTTLSLKRKGLMLFWFGFWQYWGCQPRPRVRYVSTLVKHL